MAYAQINYTEELGNGKYTIKEVGCFLTAFCNLLSEDFGEDVAPDTLNDFFKAHGTYVKDPDGALEDLAWGSVSAYDGNVHVSGSGNGAPPSTPAIVKFVYKSVQTGLQTTHFCRVADASQGLITDSWDGKVKSWNVYGGPVAYATYTKSVPQPVPPVQPISTPAPAAQPPTTYTVQDIPDKQITLKLDPTKLWNLNLTSWSAMTANPIAASKGGTVVTVKAIAHHKLGGAYYMPDPGKPEGYNMVDCEDYTPPAPEAPKPAAPAKPANVVFTKLDSPLKLATNKQPTNVWDLNFKDDAHAASNRAVDKGTVFIAYGKAQRTDLDKPAYFMSQEDFGDADTSGVPAKYEGINTVDLSPVAAPAAPAPAASDGETVPVKVVPADPNKWQQSYTKNLGAVAYVANTNAVIDDLSGTGAPEQLIKGQKVNVVGTFEKDGQKYYRTAKSAADGLWYGLPVDVLTKESELKDDNFIEDALKEVPKLRAVLGPQNGREKALATAATVDGFFSRLLHRNKK